MTFTMARRNHISILLAFSMLFSIFFLAATPPAEAGLFRCLAKIGRAVAVTASAITGGVIGAVVGCVVGGPVGALAGFTAGAILGGVVMGALTSTTGSSAMTGAAIGAIHGACGGPLGMLAGAVVGGVVGGAIGYVAEGCHHHGHCKKGVVVASGYIKGSDKTEKTGVIETSEPVAGEREEPAESLPTDIPAEEPVPEEPATEVPQTPETEATGATTYSDASEEAASNGSATEDPANMTVEASIQFLVMQSKNLDSNKKAVLDNKASSAEYENLLDQRELVADSLTRKLISEIEENNGQPGEAYNQFTTNIKKLEPQKRAALKDVIEAVKDNAVHNQSNNPGINSYQSLAAELGQI